MRRAILTASLLLLMAATAQAQSPSSQASTTRTTTLTVPAVATGSKSTFRFDLGDAAYWGGAALDTASSLGKRELSPLFRDERGIYRPGANLALKGGVWGGIKLLEWKYPERRRTWLWLKIGVGIAYGAVAAHNWQVGRVK